MYTTCASGAKDVKHATSYATFVACDARDTYDTHDTSYMMIAAA